MGGIPREKPSGQGSPGPMSGSILCVQTQVWLRRSSLMVRARGGLASSPLTFLVLAAAVDFRVVSGGFAVGATIFSVMSDATTGGVGAFLALLFHREHLGFEIQQTLS